MDNHGDAERKTYSLLKNQLGKLVDGGATYYAIGMTELCVLCSMVGLSPITKLDPIPTELSRYSFWQYGSGEHCSKKRAILVSIVIKCRSDLNNRIGIRHLVVEGSSQWLQGRNITH